MTWRRWLALVVVAVLLAGCGGSDGGGEVASQGSSSSVADPGPIHVHGLGVNPGDGALFVATHTGLFRVGQGEREARRVAGRTQDTMGFTVVGPDRFLGSGHPDLREDLPPFLGLIESRDAGETWKPISLLGRRDFHVLEANGRRIYGFGSDFKTRQAGLLVSDNRGRSWDERPAPELLISLAIDPENPDRVLASGEKGLYLSRNGGRRWNRVEERPWMLSWPQAHGLFGVAGDGTVARSQDGATWQRVGDVGGQPGAFEGVSGNELYVALHDGTIKRSGDGGRSWTVRSTP